MENSHRKRYSNLFSVEGGYIMETILTKIAELGPTGLFAVILAYNVFYLQRKLIQVVETNTAAMSSLKQYCKEHNRDISSL